jgi:hypothetical protein
MSSVSAIREFILTSVITFANKQDISNVNCSGGNATPATVPLIAALTLINAANWVRLLGQGATCQTVKLPF